LDQIFIKDAVEGEEIREQLDESEYLDDPVGLDYRHNK
jgi:hypothetical protein